MASPHRDPESSRRRRVLQSAGGVALAALAGCVGDDSAPAPPESTTTATSTVRTTTSGTGTTTSVDPDVQRETAVRLAQLLGAGDFETAHGLLSPTVREQLSVEGLRSAWEQTTANYGGFTGVGGVERTTAQGYDVLLVRTQFEAGVLNVQVVFEGASVEGLRFLPSQESYSPPDYADQDSFTERTLELETPSCPLGATLTTPTGGGGGDGDAGSRGAGVVLVHGSGPHDRDETIGPNKPFRDLAWGLATKGVTVLRYEKRTFACDVGMDELGFGGLVVDDALTALQRLREEVDVSSSAVVGHSLGAYAAPRIANEDGDASAFLLAAPSRPLYAIVPDQVRYLANLDGAVTDAEREQIEDVEATADRLSAGDYDGGGFGWSAAFWRDVAGYDPVATATDLDRPVYALQGGRDYQVSPDADFPAWRDALGSERTRLFDSLNHLFMPGEGQPNPNEYFQPGNVAESVVADLAAWLTG